MSKKAPRPILPAIPDSVTHFYRYSRPEPLQWLQRTMLRHEIYVPRAKELNDPTESKPRIAHLSPYWLGRFLKRNVTRRKDLSREERERLFADIEAGIRSFGADQIRAEIAELFYKDSELTRVFSMSLRVDNLLLWATYADNHRGYCLEFSRAGMFTVAKAVLYDDSFELDVSDPSHAALEWHFCKSPNWSAEEEVRLVIPQGRGGPYFPINPEWLTRVVLGKEMSESNRAQIRQWARERVPELKVAVADFDVLDRRLHIKDLT